MTKLKQTVVGVSTFLGTTYLMMGNVFADTLCPSGDKNAGQFGGLCTKGTNTEGVISLVINVLLFVAFIAALIYLIIGGVRWITSGGDKEGTGKAKATVTAALIGLVIVLASWILLNVIAKFFGITGINSIALPTLGT